MFREGRKGGREGWEVKGAEGERGLRKGREGYTWIFVEGLLVPSYASVRLAIGVPDAKL